MMIQVKRSFDDCCWFQNKGMIQMQSASFSQLLLAVLSFQQLYLPFDYRSCAANWGFCYLRAWLNKLERSEDARSFIPPPIGCTDHCFPLGQAMQQKSVAAVRECPGVWRIFRPAAVENDLSKSASIALAKHSAPSSPKIGNSLVFENPLVGNLATSKRQLLSRKTSILQWEVVYRK